MSPVTKILSDAIKPMVESFLKPEGGRLTQVQLDLIRRNHALGGHEYGFFHNGLLFATTAPAKLRGHQLRRAHASIAPEAEDLLAKRKRLKEDGFRMTQALIVIASRCESTQSFRDSIPEPLVEHSPYASLPRLSDEGSVLDGQPLLRSQFEKVVRIALYYSANRLIY